jgi:hypothetical protein
MRLFSNVLLVARLLVVRPRSPAQLHVELVRAVVVVTMGAVDVLT